MSPAELIYGRQPEQPGSFRREVELEGQDQEQDEALQAWKIHLDKLPEKHETAAENMKKANEKQAKYYNANRRKTDFEVGEKVWKINKVLSDASKARSSKLARNFAGPFTITEKIGENTFEIIHDESNKIFSPVHASQIKKFNSNEEEEPRKTESTEKASEIILRPEANKNLIISEQPRTNVANAQRLEQKRAPKRKGTASVEPAEKNKRGLDRQASNVENFENFEPIQTRSRPHRNNTRILIRSCRDTLHRGLVHESSLRSHRDSNDTTHAHMQRPRVCERNLPYRPEVRPRVELAGNEHEKIYRLGRRAPHSRHTSKSAATNRLKHAQTHRKMKECRRRAYAQIKERRNQPSQARSDA
ncbi:unnamed protein product [Trichogramma brassicae]|uniref:Uncharacterized protein n=1 Tax=Trichogramma brassicae TaxID=86971 RepID=A0A6H5IE17_9HYME|nr:unnamed protein product [Trichogramma brassicae]